MPVFPTAFGVGRDAEGRVECAGGRGRGLIQGGEAWLNIEHIFILSGAPSKANAATQRKKSQTHANEPNINTFRQHYLNGAGVANPRPR